MKVDMYQFGIDVGRLRLCVDNQEIDARDPQLLLGFLQRRYGKKASMYIAHYCCQTAYVNALERVLKRLKPGETLFHNGGLVVKYNTDSKMISVTNNFKMAYVDDVRGFCFEIDNVKMTLFFDVLKCTETCRWYKSMQRTYI